MDINLTNIMAISTRINLVHLSRITYLGHHSDVLLGKYLMENDYFYFMVVNAYSMIAFKAVFVAVARVIAINKFTIITMAITTEGHPS